MKKFSIYSSTWLLSLLLVALVAGCGSYNHEGEATADSTEKALTAYSLNGADGVIDELAKTILVTVPYGTDRTALVATYASTGDLVQVGTVQQESTLTENDFTAAVVYTVTAADNTTALYTVTVTVALEDAKAITAYALAGVAGIVDEEAKTIAVTMPYGTDMTALVAIYTSTGDLVEVGTVQQESTLTENDFTEAVIYTVTAADGTTALYTVTVTVAPADAKAITAYALAGVAGIIDQEAKTIAVTVPYRTDRTALVATYTSTGDLVQVGTVQQESTLTENDFTEAVVYTVTAADNTTALYTVTVTVALEDAKAITAYSLGGASGAIDESAKTISVTVPNGTEVTALIATYTTTGDSVHVGATVQASASTANDFTNPVVYTVTAADGSTALYTVTVMVSPAQGPAPVNLGTAGNFVILAKSGVSTTGTTAVVGDIGVSPADATYITGFDLIADATGTFATSSLVTGRVYAANYATPTPAMMTAAISDMEIAYDDAAGRTDIGSFNELHAGDISGQTLVPGLYKWGTGVAISSVGVTLEGGENDVWIFQIAQNLTVGNSAIVTLSGGAQAKNIFWQVSGQATLGTAADFKGIILSKTLISLNTGATMTGRALAQTAVTLNATAITEPAL